MGDYRVHLRELDRLAHLAWQEAKRLRSTVIGPEEFVLAILHAEAGDSVAAFTDYTARRELDSSPLNAFAVEGANGLT